MMQHINIRKEIDTVFEEMYLDYMNNKYIPPNFNRVFSEIDIKEIENIKGKYAKTRAIKKSAVRITGSAIIFASLLLVYAADREDLPGNNAGHMCKGSGVYEDLRYHCLKRLDLK
jgi:hypothetical protein